MLEAIEHKGAWWLPDQSDDITPGTVRFDPEEGISLDLIGTLGVNFHTGKVGTVLGRLAGGENVTLFNCFVKNHNINYPGLRTQIFRANLMVTGAHLSHIDDLSFSRVQLYLENLAGWAKQLSGFEIEIRSEANKATIRYELPEAIEANIAENLRLKLGVRASGPSRSRPQQEASITERTYFTVESPSEVGWNTWLGVVNRLRNFISLAVRNSVRPVEIIGKSEAAMREMNGQKYYESIHVYYRLVGQNEVYKPVLPHSMLFSLNEIEKEFEKILKNWFEKSSLLEPVFNQYFSDLHAPDPYMQGRFLNLVQALEAYHRRALSTTDLPADEHEERVASILDSVPGEHQDWLSGQLYYSNELSLRRRLKELIDRYSFVLNDFIDKGRFSHDTVSTRNYLIHYDESIKDQAASGIEILALIKKLKTLLEISFLHELGFDESTIIELMRKSINERREFVNRNT